MHLYSIKVTVTSAVSSFLRIITSAPLEITAGAEGPKIGTFAAGDNNGADLTLSLRLALSGFIGIVALKNSLVADILVSSTLQSSKPLEECKRSSS